MINDKKREVKQDNNQLSGFLAGFLFLGGLLLGSIVGARAMLLMAPQSGKKTRKQIKRKGREMQKQTAKTVNHKAEQSIQADQAEMDWADDGGRIVPVNVDSLVQPGE